MSDGIKIKELPRISHGGISNSSLMAIDLSDDTYAISVADLLVIFSADKKLEALRNEFTNTLSENTKELTELIKNLKDTVNSMDTNVRAHGEWQTQAKEQILNIQQKINEIEAELEEHGNNITEINDTISEITETLSGCVADIVLLKTTTEDHTVAIENIENQLETEGEYISSIDQVVDEYIDLNNKTVAELKKTDSDNKKELKEVINEKYDDIMKYIDYYHHYHENPPNFDEPFYYERELAGYCYPIHSLYHTTDSSWNPANYKVPGDWVLRTTITLDDNLIEYIYERVN